MGCLLRIVDILELLKGDTVDRYQLKLTIIENCVYGVDIQPIAMLICKLRFFISLICEQNDIDFSSPETNFGINTLPNLETKFVAANTLISANIRNYEDDWTNDEKLDSMKEKLLCIRNDHFLAKGRVAKKRSERQDNATRQQLLDDILAQVKATDGKQTQEQVEELTDHLWQDIQKVLELARRAPALNNPGCRVEVAALEKDPEIIRAMAGLEPGFASYGLLLPLARGLTRLEGPNFALELLMGDAARALKQLAPGFDAVFFDPFSPAKAPELWSGEVFRDVAGLMNPGAVLTTYSCAGWVRRNMRSAGLSPQDGPRVCRRSPSTVAFK